VTKVQKFWYNIKKTSNLKKKKINRHSELDSESVRLLATFYIEAPI